METVVGILIVISMCLFSIDTYRCFSKVYEFEHKNGYRDETICYIKSPHVDYSRRGRIIFVISKWLVKAIVIGTWLSSIYLLIHLNDLFNSMLIVFAGYMIVYVWYEYYSNINGAKILDTGIANGLEKVKWSNIEEFQFNTKKNKLLERSYIKLKRRGRFMPIYISVTTENKDLVQRLIKEKCVA